MNSSEAKTLLLFVPDHTRTSCSDSNISNDYTTPGRGGYPRCTRCALLSAANSEFYAETLSLDSIRVLLPEE